MERLQKVLARAGIASRRACEEMISAGRVTVNGVVVTELGTQVDFEKDVLAVDGRIVSTSPALKYVMVNKPVGYVCTTSDPQGRRTVLELIPDEDAPRMFPVGRLDTDSEGLLLMTNDGALTERLTHPRYGLEKEYMVWVDGHPSDEDLASLRAGIPLDGKPAPVDSITIVPRPPLSRTTTLLRVIVHEGRNREIRRLCDAIGFPVQRLQRVRLGPLYLGELASGAARQLTREEVLDLKAPAPKAKEEVKPAHEQRYPVTSKRYSTPSRFGAPGGDAGRGQRPRPPTSEWQKPERPARPDYKPSRGDRFAAPEQRAPQADRPARFSRGPRPAAPAPDFVKPEHPAMTGFKAGHGPRFALPAGPRTHSERPPRPEVNQEHDERFSLPEAVDRRAERPDRPAFKPGAPRFASHTDDGQRSERPARPPYRPTHAPRFAPPTDTGERSDRPDRPPYRPTHAPRFAPPTDAGEGSERPARPPYRPTYAPRFAPSAPAGQHTQHPMPRTERPAYGARFRHPAEAGAQHERPAFRPSGPGRGARPGTPSGTGYNSRPSRPAFSPDRSQRPARPEPGAEHRPDGAQGTNFRRSNAHHAPYRINNHDRRPSGGGEERPRRTPRR